MSKYSCRKCGLGFLTREHAEACENSSSCPADGRNRTLKCIRCGKNWIPAVPGRDTTYCDQCFFDDVAKMRADETISRRLLRQGPTLTLETTKAVFDLLMRLVSTGFYGETVEAAAEQLLRERLRQIEESENRLAHAKAARLKKGTMR